MFSKARDCCCKCHGHIKLHLVKKIICSWFPSPHFRNRNIPLIVGNLPFFSLHVCAECRPSVIFFNSVIFLPTMFIHPIYYWAWVSAFLILIWQVSLLLHGTLSIYLSYFFCTFSQAYFFSCVRLTTDLCEVQRTLFYMEQWHSWVWEKVEKVFALTLCSQLSHWNEISLLFLLWMRWITEMFLKSPALSWASNRFFSPTVSLEVLIQWGVLVCRALPFEIWNRPPLQNLKITEGH